VDIPTHFTIFTKGAGKAKPEVQFKTAFKGNAVKDFEIIDNHDYSYTVKYTALHQVRSHYHLLHVIVALNMNIIKIGKVMYHQQ